LHPKAIAEKAEEHFFLLASPLIFDMPIPGGSAKRPWCLFFGTYSMVFFPKQYFLLHGRRKASGKSLRKFFIFFTEVLLKSRVCLHHPPISSKRDRGLTLHAG
jgi:hypothetical protein